MAKPPKAVRDKIDAMLRMTDAKQMLRNAPILSVLVVDDDTGVVSPVFWESVKKYDLRLPNETDAACEQRLRDKALAHRQ